MLEFGLLRCAQNSHNAQENHHSLADYSVANPASYLAASPVATILVHVACKESVVFIYLSAECQLPRLDVKA